VNIGVANPAQGSLNTQLTIVRFDEIASFGAGYRTSRGSEFDVGGGAMITQLLGVGVNMAGATHEDPANLKINIPHPFLFNRFASDEASTDRSLKRRERSVNIQAVATVPTHGRVRVRFFGGPSYLSLTADAVTDIRYRQTANTLGANTVEIMSFENKEVKSTAWLQCRH
jgi:hypothetical protein